MKGTVDATGMSFAEIAAGIQEADTWLAESWEVLSNRILTGFESIAQDLEKQGGGNALVVSHGMTIATLPICWSQSVVPMSSWITARSPSSNTKMASFN